MPTDPIRTAFIWPVHVAGAPTGVDVLPPEATGGRDEPDGPAPGTGALGGALLDCPGSVAGTAFGVVDSRVGIASFPDSEAAPRDGVPAATTSSDPAGVAADGRGCSPFVKVPSGALPGIDGWALKVSRATLVPHPAVATIKIRATAPVLTRRRNACRAHPVIAIAPQRRSSHDGYRSRSLDFKSIRLFRIPHRPNDRAHGRARDLPSDCQARNQATNAWGLTTTVAREPIFAGMQNQWSPPVHDGPLGFAILVGATVACTVLALLLVNRYKPPGLPDAVETPGSEASEG